MEQADVAVVGLGAWGAAALWRLAERGVRVVGFERFEPGHGLGSSYGRSRMFRVACLEHPGLVPLAQYSLKLWRELERSAGRQLFRRTGGWLIGHRDGHVAAGTVAAARAYDLPVEVLTAGEVRRRLPQHAGVPDDHIGVWEPSAGLLYPEESIRAAVRVAAARGARVYTDTRVTGLDLVADGAVVRTATRDFRVGQVVVTAGAWLGSLVRGLPLEPVRMPMTWFRPVGDPEPFRLERFPVFIRELDESTCIWGHGSDSDAHVKLGLEDGGRRFRRLDPDDLERQVEPADWTDLAECLAAAVPGFGSAPSRAGVCMLTRTPDRQFVLGRPHGDPRLVVGGGCNGHGFKHATGIGDLLTDIVLGKEPSCPVPFTDPNRFL